MNSTITIIELEFRPGDGVVLADGPYQGTPGTFLNLTHDVNWAEIEERYSRGPNLKVRHHPVIWLKRAGD